MSAPEGATVPQAGFLGHPAGLSTLFFTELWERFSYYGMRALLVLFLVESVREGGFGLDDQTATAIYGLYTASVYIASIPGGWVADRLIGAQRAVLWGAVLIATGHLLLALSVFGATFFYAGLAVIVLGTGLLKPNISALVAPLYPEGGTRRDAGFTFFYMAINLGGFLGPLVTAWLAQQFGWHVGFLAAAVGMTMGVVYFVRTRRRLGAIGLLSAERAAHASLARDWRAFWIVLAVVAMLCVCIGAGVWETSAVALRGGAIYVILALAAGYFAWLLFFAGLTVLERKRILVLLLLFLASTVFWAGFEQGGSSLNLFADRHMDRMLGGFEIPTGWFQSVNSAFIIIFAPLVSMFWLWLARRGIEFAPAGKFVIGLAGMALGFLVLVIGAEVVARGELAGMHWLILSYLLHTWGELALSPIGMSATTQLSPQRFMGQSMGVWFASLSLGSLVASFIAGEFDADNVAAMPTLFMNLFWFGACAALVLLLFTPLARRWSRATS